MKILAVFLVLTASAPAQKLIGWNNLGMHCMDDDYSVFSILPPYNTIDAQFINSSGDLVTSDSGITVTYEAVADPDGSINRSSIGKSNFWTYSEAYFGVALAPDAGLASKNMPGPNNEPQFLDFDGLMNWFQAEGIPITPNDDNGHTNPYPMMRLTAKSGAGTVLATTDIVLPVSGEMDCRACHGSGSTPAAEPAAGFRLVGRVLRNAQRWRWSRVPRLTRTGMSTGAGPRAATAAPAAATAATMATMAMSTSMTLPDLFD